MNYKQIHDSLKDKGLSWLLAGEVIGCSHQHVMNVCARRVESPRVAKSISVLLEKEVSDVFPDIPRYQNDRKKQRDDKVKLARQKLIDAGLAEAV
jgi:hypothetical protein